MHLVFTAGEDFVRITLMTDVPNQLVFRRVINVVQSHRQLNRAQVAGEMTAGLTDGYQLFSVEINFREFSYFVFYTPFLAISCNSVSL